MTVPRIEYPLVEVTSEEFDRVVAESPTQLYGYPFMFCNHEGYRRVWPCPPRGVGIVFEELPEKRAYFYIADKK